ncbi:thymidine kinase [Litorimonas cladophorae]|uniref:Thymidine kinase n=1 Tax=Litorimonas cladophorae TaxID=1220491 RepID=A0A918KTB4_9PROT|nr:thymidine kinase [Litorimonas cladophorae]GGX75325.1 thymidine kinase [Litorimonas cladophorae]
MAKLYFNYSAMNAGKSTILLQSSYNYHERGMRTLLIKPTIDTREGVEAQISSRIGLTAQADLITPTQDLEVHIRDTHAANPIDCVLVDEAQFLSEAQVWQLAKVADELRMPIMCYGLRTDFRGKLFPGSAALLSIADNVKEIKTLCWCGRKATMTLRVSKTGSAVTRGAQVEIGGNDRYVSLCRKHWVAKEIRQES